MKIHNIRRNFIVVNHKFIRNFSIWRRQISLLLLIIEIHHTRGIKKLTLLQTLILECFDTRIVFIIYYKWTENENTNGVENNFLK